MRPLSQTGFNRIPRNPKQRQFGEGGHKTAGTVLDAYNERQETHRLHPTKGRRELSVKRSRAEHLVAIIKAGGSADLRLMRRFLREGY